MEEINIQEFDPHSRAVQLEKTQDSIPPERMDEFVNLIRTIAATIFSGGNIPNGIEFEDLVGYGYEGLNKAWRNYKNDKGALFKTYASYRVRGEILDFIRKEWKSRNPSYTRVYDKEKALEKINEAAYDLYQETNPQTDEEKDVVLHTAISNSLVVYLLSLENIENISNILKREDVSKEIIDRFERSNERIFLQESIEELEPEEIKLIKMYYYDSKNQIDIANHLGMSKSKISRMHMRIMQKLKSKIAAKLETKWAV